MKAIIVGADQSLKTALEAEGMETIPVDGTATREALEAAGIDEADLLVVTDVAESTAIPIAKALNRALRIVIYSTTSMPEFVRAQVDLALDPTLFDADMVAEALVDSVH